ncbi:TonB-dependent receptor plug domain-containing protein [Sphingobacterium bovisgrunnientis]|uniref:TonB-dependent receptor plug domain-containing protein n=1 Tax=Sphingobacterium bovisgrunnientis TaxID=1874697 RepID=UPI00135B239D|nr:TonB-dependent receptor [Sphingobacterium bovisgrunnientis]
MSRIIVLITLSNVLCLALFPTTIFSQKAQSTTHANSISDTINHRVQKDICLEQVVVTGQYKPQSISKSVYNLRTISSDQIKSRAATNIQQLLNTQPGIRFSSDLTLGVSDIELMGMSGRNVKILVDGYPMLDRSDTRESLNQIDVNMIERIEIVEGPMSVIYGSDALAGVINIITKSPKNSKYSVFAKVQEETVGNEYDFHQGKGIHQKSVGINWRKENIYADATVSSNQFGGWNLPSKSAFIQEVNAISNKWKPKDQYLGNIKLGYKNDKIHIWYRTFAMHEDIDSRYGINPNTYLAKLQTYRTNRYNHQISSNWLISEKFGLEVSAAYTDLSRKTITTIHDYNSNTSTLSTEKGEQDLAEFNTLFLRPTLQHYLSEKLTFQYGLEFNKDAGTGARIKGRPHIQDMAAFISSEYKPLTKLTIRPGVRFLKNSVYDAPKFVPALNTKFDITRNLNLRLSYAKGYRAPALRELYFDFVDASHAIIGNENLKAETSNSWNGTVSYQKFHAANNQLHKVNLSSFYNVFNDRIDYAIDSANPSITTLLNIDTYKSAGFTWDNSINFAQLKTTLGFSYIGRYNRLSENLNTVNEFSWTPEIFGELTYLLQKSKTSLNLFVKHSGKRPSYQLSNSDVNTAQLVKLDGMTIADAMINQPVLKYLIVNFGVKNLFNVTTLNSTQTVSSGAHSSSNGVSTNYGRSFVLGLTYNMTK